MNRLDATRVLDIVFSVTFLLFVLPVWVIVIPILRYTGEGEIFYRQPRVGKDGRLFDLIKFATMLKNSPNLGAGELTLHNDPRVLPVGRFLRKSKINELPQLLNVLRGDMSIVGPRPQTPRCFAAFSEAVQQRLVQLRPGLSGIGAIVFRGEERLLEHAAEPTVFYDAVIMPYKGEIEQWYIENQTLRNYILVILATIWVILFPRSQVAWHWFKGLPQPPEELAGLLR